jgi:hypothetical protein
MQASSSPPESTSPADTSPWYARTSPLDILVSIGLIAMLVSGPAVSIADQFWSLQLTPIWEQIFGLFMALLLLIVAIKVQRLRRSIRLLCVVGALIILIAVGDSLDGKPDFLPFITLLLGGWGISFAHTTHQIAQRRQRLSRVQWLGYLLGIVATIGYLSAAVFYLVLNLTQGPQVYHHHDLFGVGFIIASMLRLIATAAEKQAIAAGEAIG